MPFFAISFAKKGTFHLSAATTHVGSGELHHHFIWTRDVEVAPNKLTCKIGIHLGRIEQGNAVLQPVTLRLQLDELSSPLFEQVLVLAPGKKAAGTGDAVKPHQEEHGEGKPLHETVPGNVGFLSHGSHGLIESQVIRRYKQNSYWIPAICDSMRSSARPGGAGYRC